MSKSAELGALDQTIVAVSPPSISSDLHGFETVAWIVSGYLVAATVITPTDAHTIAWISTAMGIAGFAIGLQLPTALVAAQTAVLMRHMGIGTASIVFFRSLGGAIGVAVLSALLNYVAPRPHR